MGRRVAVAERSRGASVAPRRCACGRLIGPTGQCETCRRLQLAETARSNGGRPLEAARRAEHERRFGFDLSGVRVHDDARADEEAVA